MPDITVSKRAIESVENKLFYLADLVRQDTSNYDHLNDGLAGLLTDIAHSLYKLRGGDKDEANDVAEVQ